MLPISRVLEDTYYFLYKEFGTTLTFTKRVKSDTDPDTGLRTSGDRDYTVSAVFTPIGVTSQFILQLLGKSEKYGVSFVVLRSSLPEYPETTDEILHANVKYRNLTIEDFDSVLILSGEAFK